jgi:hypothetical protein
MLGPSFVGICTSVLYHRLQAGCAWKRALDERRIRLLCARSGRLDESASFQEQTLLPTPRPVPECLLPWQGGISPARFGIVVAGIRRHHSGEHRGTHLLRSDARGGEGRRPPGRQPPDWQGVILGTAEVLCPAGVRGGVGQARRPERTLALPADGEDPTGVKPHGRASIRLACENAAYGICKPLHPIPQTNPC